MNTLKMHDNQNDLIENSSTHYLLHKKTETAILKVAKCVETKNLQTAQKISRLSQ